jgi:hypothetical protein
MPPKTELQHHLEVAKWLKRKKNIIPIFRTDYAAGLKLSKGQAKTHHRLQSGKSYPDLFIPKPVGAYHGLYLELKTPDAGVVLKDGSITTRQHIRDQLDVLRTLQELGYAAAMVIGHTQAKQAIEAYLSGAKIFPHLYLIPEAPEGVTAPDLDEDLPF